jgi:hypothetical protein
MLAEYLLHSLSYQLKANKSRGDNAETKTRGSKNKVDRQDIEAKKDDSTAGTAYRLWNSRKISSVDQEHNRV